MNEEVYQSRLLKQIGGAIFGAIVSLGITSSIQNATELIFASEAEEWGIGFWGDHNILRVVASVIGSSVGGFAAGCIAKIRGGLWGLLSALPTSLFWVTVGVLVLYRVLEKKISFEITFGTWAVIIILIIASLVVGFYTGIMGQSVRLENPEIFESKPHIILGIKWYHWFWLFTINHWIVMMGTYSIFQGIFLFFGSSRYLFLHSVNSIIAIFLVGIGLCLLCLSGIKIFSFTPFWL